MSYVHAGREDDVAVGLAGGGHKGKSGSSWWWPGDGVEAMWKMNVRRVR